MDLSCFHLFWSKHMQHRYYQTDSTISEETNWNLLFRIVCILLDKFDLPLKYDVKHWRFRDGETGRNRWRWLEQLSLWQVYQQVIPGYVAFHMKLETVTLVCFIGCTRRLHQFAGGPYWKPGHGSAWSDSHGSLEMWRSHLVVEDTGSEPWWREGTGQRPVVETYLFSSSSFVFSPAFLFNFLRVYTMINNIFMFFVSFEWRILSTHEYHTISGDT